ncbi:MAG: tRNA dihydrouridine synthase DusB [Candidatus Gastranaerophilales bacterium]|nr:tRNA dihydrouridine synthase DusB [Candidatus Gastranaerophilales bacterium]
MQTTENKNQIKIGNVVINSKVSLAPLAGITDFVLRQLIREYSSTCLLTTEMLSSEALVQRPDANIAYTNGKEEPAAFQIEGHKPDLMARSAKILEDRATIIDINMGCPIKKIVNGNDGCSLMKNPQLAKDIVVAVKESVKIPVTCKFRLGWSSDTKNFVEFAQLMQEAGVSAVTVHGRTRSQMYAGTADWNEISKLKGEIDIPYFANGDIISPETAKECLEISKADGVAIGRASMGDLSIIHRIEKYLNEDILIPEPTLEEKIKMLKKHLDFQISFRGEETGIKFFRKFYPTYIRNIRGGGEYRHRLVTELNYNNIVSILNEIVANAGNE